jgi:FtsH-binding integral membrane protein
MEPQLNNQLNQDEEVNKVVMSNIGLNRYLTRLYRTSGAALMLTLASSYACIVFPELQAYSEFLILGGGALSFLSFKRAQEIRPKFFEEKLKDDTINRTSNGPVRLAIFSIGCISMGLSASPFFAAVQDVSSTIVPMTMGVTAAIFGGASLVGLLLPRSTMLGYGGVLGGSFFGLISLNATGVLAAKYLGITVFANTLTTAESYMGIGIFTLMIIYDTHMAIKRYQRGDADHLGMSIQLLLDIWNLIIKIAKEVAKAKLKQNDSKSGSSNENNKK